jgi:hypothetical protein
MICQIIRVIQQLVSPVDSAIKRLLARDARDLLPNSGI